MCAARSDDLSFLHPVVRASVEQVLAVCQQENLPFRVFEAFRSPDRQQSLYDQGRTRAGDIVTKAKPWRSYHQYGLAVDFVIYENDRWSWDASGDRRQMWERLHEIGRALQLEPLSWELPHLQIAGISISDLEAGRYPADGDQSWELNLTENILAWKGSPASPPLPQGGETRPPLPIGELLTESASAQKPPLAKPGSGDWHSKFGGQEWKYDGGGVYLRSVGGGNQPLRTIGEPTTCQRILSLMGEIIFEFSRKFDVPPEIILMTIATETSIYRDVAYTGARTFRWESAVNNTDMSPAFLGSYSAGPMQTLATTARWVIRQQSLPFDPFVVAPPIRQRPVPAPDSLPLYDYPANIHLGTAEIKQRWNLTGSDPILIAAAYNAGGIRESTENEWHIRTQGNHLQRAAEFYGDACHVLNPYRQ